MNMSGITSILLIVGMISSIWVDAKKFKQALPSEKWMYGGMTAFSIGVFTCIQLDINLPLPTRFVVYQIVPWVGDMLSSF